MTTRPTKRSPARQSSIVAACAKWLDANREKFPVPLICIARKGDRRAYRFRGVPALRLCVGGGSFFVEVRYRRRFIDEFLIADVPVPRRSRAGRYYCATCKSEGHAEYAEDRLSLLKSHTFEPFLDWYRERIREDSLLVVEGEPGRSTTAHILSPKELKACRKRLQPGFVVEPLFKASGSVPGRRARRRAPPR